MGTFYLLFYNLTFREMKWELFSTISGSLWSLAGLRQICPDIKAFHSSIYEYVFIDITVTLPSRDTVNMFDMGSQAAQFHQNSISLFSLRACKKFWRSSTTLIQLRIFLNGRLAYQSFFGGNFSIKYY